MSNLSVISNQDLMNLGYKKSTASAIIHEARDLLVDRGYTFYTRKRLMVVPKSVVEEILGVEL